MKNTIDETKKSKIAITFQADDLTVYGTEIERDLQNIKIYKKRIKALKKKLGI